MQSLNQGIEFKDKKIQYGGLVKAVNTIEDLQEGFQGIREGLEQRISPFNDQIIDFGEMTSSPNTDVDKIKFLSKTKQ